MESDPAGSKGESEPDRIKKKLVTKFQELKEVLLILLPFECAQLPPAVWRTAALLAQTTAARLVGVYVSVKWHYYCDVRTLTPAS